MSEQHMGEGNGLATNGPRERSGVAAYAGRLLILACVLLGIAGDALAVYSPRTGRFLQKDPNESGMLHAELWHEGDTPIPALAAGSLASAMIDGANLFQHVRGAPFCGTDPSGLFGLWYTEATIDAGSKVGLFVHDLVSQYNENLEFAIEWALDPTMDGDWLTTSVTPDWSLLAPDHHDLRGDIEEMYMGGAAGSTTRVLLRVAGKAVRKGHWHHIIPRYLSKYTGSSEVLVRIPKKLHHAYHKQLDHALRKYNAPHMRAPASKWKRWVKKDLGGKTELAEKIIRDVLKTETRKFARKHNITGLVKTLEKELKELAE